MAELKSGLAAYLDALGSLPAREQGSPEGWMRYVNPFGPKAEVEPEEEPIQENRLLTEVKPDPKP